MEEKEGYHRKIIQKEAFAILSDNFGYSKSIILFI